MGCPSCKLHDPGAVKALFDKKQRTMLAPFFEPISIAEAAAMVEAHPATVLLSVRRMVKFGVVTQVDVVRRHGKRVNRFQTVADKLFVPLSLCDDLVTLPEKRFHALYSEAMREELISYHHNVQAIGAVVRLLPMCFSNYVVNAESQLKGRHVLLCSCGGSKRRCL